jgi:DNA polymerase V
VDGTLSRQIISCSRTFGRPLTAQADVLAAVTPFLSRAAEKLRRQSDQAYVLTVYVQKNRFDPRVPLPHSRSATLTLPSGPTADTLALARYASHLLAKHWEPGMVYHKVGVVLDGLESPSSGQQLGLFAPPAAALVPSAPMLASKRAELMAQRTCSTPATVAATCAWVVPYLLPLSWSGILSHSGRGRRSGNHQRLLRSWKIC